MEIVIYSDYACPFCYIGEKRLEKAIEKAGIENVNIKYKSFLLDSEQRDDIEGSPVENLAEKYGYTIERANYLIGHVVKMAKDEGLNYDYENLKERNTIKAHRLLHLAIDKGVGDEVNEKLFSAHLVEGKDLSDYEVLIEIGVSSGIKREDIEGMYKTDKYLDEIQKDINQARELGITSVPYFIIDNNRSIRGAQSVDIMVKDLTRKKDELL